MSALSSLADDADAPDTAHRIAVAAHEIRTPIGGILALADLILAEDLTEAARSHINALKASAEHLFDVASGLIGGAAPAGTVEMSLGGFTARVAPPIAARAAMKGLTFRVALAPGVPERVVADEGALRQIIENLADNALRATEVGAIELAIDRVTSDHQSVTLRFALRDTGLGLGPDPHRLFAPYVQGDGPSGAAGLGLSLVASLARRMDGRADALNRPGGGAEVSVTVRLGAVAGTAAAGGPLKVLVAEDNAVNRRVVGALLERFGHDFDMVDNGAAAVAEAASGAYDLVLMDAVMPTLDGLAATRAIRAMPGAVGQVRIVGLTARAFDHEIASFLAAGADAVVTKPISVAELWRAIDAGSARRAAV